MSRMQVYVQICCDHPECGKWQETTHTSMRSARKHMHRSYGWATRRKDGQLIDLCAECKVKP
jgi:hypothetical protein